MTRPTDAVRSAVRGSLGTVPNQGPNPALGLVACSGGADSLALAAGAAQAGRQAGWQMGAVIVDHQLQPGSAAVAARAAEVCRGLGLDPVVEVKVEVRGPGGPEAAARRARYDALAAAVGRTGAAALLLGHTMDDQAETVLLGLARGSGARSLSGMPARAELPGAPGAVLLRPLLGIRRAATQAACQSWGLQPWQDPHNVDPAFTRVRARRDVLPMLADALGPGVPEALARSARLLRDDDAALAAIADDVLRELHRAGGGGPAIACDLLADHPAAVRRRVLRSVALAAGVPAAGLHASHVFALDELVTRPRAVTEVRLPGGVAARVRYGRLELARREDCAMEPSHLPGVLEHVLLSEEQITERLAEIADEIAADYREKPLMLVGVLKGAVMVMADLSRALPMSVEMDWMAVSSYGSGTTSSGVVRILKDLDADISGRHVLIVEDILDSGLTLKWLLKNLASRGPASLEVCTLLRKPDAVKVNIQPKYVGFDIPSEFVVGYGLDYAGHYRNLRAVGTLAPHIYNP